MTADLDRLRVDDHGAARAPSPDVDVLLPAAGRAGVGELVAQIADSATVLPFAEERTAFLAEVSRGLRRRGRGIPQIEALAFWIRPSQIATMAGRFAALGDDTTLLMPRGTVFHVPPANVDTIFVYSLVLSLLAGNRNIVRLSQRSLADAAPILDALREAAQAHPGAAESLRIISYGHDDAVSAALTASCDVRVLWGGDATIAAFRRFPLPPHATELAFADRFSLAAVSTDAYRQLADGQRDDLAERFVNDTYWFDQLGCSSARLLVWVGDTDFGDTAEDFHRRVRDAARGKGYTVDTAAAIGKIGQSYRSMVDGHITGYHWYDNTEVVLDTATFPPARGEFCGAGLFYQWVVPDLDHLAPHIRREDQTLAVFGFPPDELRAFALSLRGRGIDRIVPIGQALTFNPIWDGHDLMQELTRKVTLT